MGYEPSDSGKPCWYENGADDVDAAAQEGEPLPNWVFSMEVSDVDASLQAPTAAGARVLRPAADIPGTGRFAVIADPQGAVVGLMRPDPMDEAPAAPAFAPGRTGHAVWQELSTSDPEAALAFYSAVFGWTVTGSLDMGEHGTYSTVAGSIGDVGGVMPLNGAPRPTWRVYFQVDSTDAAVAQAAEAGGRLHNGPNRVPGGDWVAMLTDDQGAAFGVSSPVR